MSDRRASEARAVIDKAAVLGGALLLCACATPAPKSYIVLLDSPDSERPSVVTVTNDKGTRTLRTPGEYVGLDEAADVAPRDASQAMIERDFGAALDAEPEKPRRFLLYFLAGSVELTDASAALLPSILAEVGERRAPDVGIVGHTDTIGTAESNAELAERRALAVKALVIDAGVAAELIRVTSLGERNPLVVTADEVDEPQNRRVEVVIR